MGYLESIENNSQSLKNLCAQKISHVDMTIRRIVILIVLAVSVRGSILGKRKREVSQPNIDANGSQMEFPKGSVQSPVTIAAPVAHSRNVPAWDNSDVEKARADNGP